MVNTVIDVDINNERYSVLTYEQVERLDCVLQSTLPIHGRGNFPTLEVKLKDLVSVVRRKLVDDCITVRDIRMNGGAASNILASRVQSYNDVDLIFFVDLSSQRSFDKVKTAVLNSLMDFLPEGVSKTRISMKEGYVNKMVKVNDVDKWSLISLSNYGGRNIELKFVDTMKRQFEFSVDSFQILLDSILFFYDCTKMPINQNVYPTVIGDSVYGNFAEAFYHLTKKLFATKCPEEIRGGGLLKYCYLLVKNYKPVDDCDTKSMQRYMCSRFFIDFPDANQQLSKLEAYLCNHLVGADESLRVDYLNILYRVVNQSTVCLMGHERRQTLKLIDDLACRIYYSDLSSKESRQCSSPTDSCCSSKSSASSASSCEVSQPLHPPPPPLIYSNGYYYAPIMPGPTSSSTIPQCTCGWVQCA